MGDYNRFIKRMTQDIYPKDKKEIKKEKQIKKENKNG